MVSHPFLVPSNQPVRLFYASNREALKQLERERDWLSGICGVLGSGGRECGLPPGIAGGPVLAQTLQKVS